MKTPMQQMIDQLEAENILTCKNNSLEIEYSKGLQFAIDQAKQLLEVEKEEYVNFGNYARHPVNAMITVDGLFSKTFKND
jgi:hypothetical protein